MIFKDRSEPVHPEDSEEYAAGASADATEAAQMRIEQLEQELAETKDQLLRRTAEIDNMRRRHHEERDQIIYDSNKRLLSDLLSTLDDLERTLAHIGSEKTAVAQGMELLYKNFQKVLERYGLEPMSTEGAMFDVQAHDAMMEEPRADLEPGTITKEIQKGYLLNGSVLRHAKVIVAKEPQ